MNLEGVPAQTLARLLSLTPRLTTRRDLDGLLHDLLDGSKTLIPAADFVCVFLYRSEENALVPVGGFGFDMAYLKDIRIKPGESMTGKAYQSRQPLLLATSATIRAAQHNLSPQHDRLVRLAVGRPENVIRSSMAVPLIAGQRTMGVLVIDNYDTDRDFNGQDLAVATSLADHAALAVLNAEDYQRTRSLSHELERTIRLQKRLLTSMMSPHASMKELIKTLWTMLERPIAVYDDEGYLVVQYGGSPESPYRIPIQVGNTKLGELAMGRANSESRAHGAIEQALPLIALEFMKRQALEEERLKSARHAFYHIWDGHAEQLEQVIRKYHLARSAWQFLLVTEADPVLQRGLDTLAREKDFLALHNERHIILLVSTEQRDALNFLLGEAAECQVFWGEESPAKAELSVQLRSLVLLSLVSRTYYPCTAQPTARPVYLKDYPEIKVVQGLSEETRHDYAHHMLSTLQSDPTVFDSVVAYISCNRSINDTAARLHTHPNTIRYRLDKASQLLGRPLSDDRTLAQLRWALLAILDPQL